MSPFLPRLAQRRKHTLFLAMTGLWCLWAILLLGIGRGSFLSKHESIVAQVARQTLQNGNWVVPHFLDVPYLLKPPLPLWLTAIAGFLMPADEMTGLPVSTAVARLPSLLATLMTILVVYLLATSMFGRAIGACATFIYASAAGAMAFAFNATAEALLTLFCTWAYAEFWWSRSASGRAKRIHQIRFFIAFGLANLAKGPMPLIVVALPLAVWWFTEQSIRVLAGCGLRALPISLGIAGRGAFRRLRLAATDLGLWWGIPLAAALVVPWMWAVSLRVPYAWRLWQYEYVDRLHDEQAWTGSHGPLYYLPMFFGLAAPWLLSLPEALAGPFLARYRQHRAPLIYAWCWVVGAVVALSMMRFKQDYYLLPTLPGCALLLGPVLHRLFIVPSAPVTLATVRKVRFLVIAVMLGVIVAGIAALGDGAADGRIRIGLGLAVSLAVLFGVGVLCAARLFLSGRKPYALLAIGFTSLVIFAVTWIATDWNKQQPHERMALVSGLRQAGVGDNEDVYWADNVPDGRITFYFNRPIRHISDPFELRAMNRERDSTEVLFTVGAQICTLLDTKSMYIVFERRRFNMLMSVFRCNARILFEVDRPPAGPDDRDWLVVTNRSLPTAGTWCDKLPEFVSLMEEGPRSPRCAWEAPGGRATQWCWGRPIGAICGFRSIPFVFAPSPPLQKNTPAALGAAGVGEEEKKLTWICRTTAPAGARR